MALLRPNFLHTVFLLAGMGFAIAQTSLINEASLMKDPDFKKRFMGSYGFLPEVEPKMDPNNKEEKKQFEAVAQLLADETLSESNKLASLQQLVTEQSHPSLQFILGNLYYTSGRTELAEKWYVSAINEFPSFRRAHKNLGLIQFDSGKRQQAAQSLLKAVELGEFSSQVFGVLGVAHLDKEDYLAAEAAFRQALMLDPAKKEWTKGLLSAYMGAERYSEATALLNRLIAEEPENDKYWLMRATALKFLNRDEDSIKAFEILRLMGKATPGQLTLLGNLYMDADNPNAALVAYQDALEVTTKIDGAAVLRTANLLFGYDYIDQSEGYVNLLKGRVGELSESDKLQLKTLEAKLATARGDDAQAAVILEEVITRDNSNGEARIELAQYYVRQMQSVAGEDEDKERKYFAKAKLYFDQALLIESSEAKAALRYGQMHVGRREFQKAVPLLRRSLKLEPRDDVEQFVRQVERSARTEKAREDALKKQTPLAGS